MEAGIRSCECSEDQRNSSSEVVPMEAGIRSCECSEDQRNSSSEAVPMEAEIRSCECSEDQRNSSSGAVRWKQKSEAVNVLKIKEIQVLKLSDGSKNQKL